MILVIIHMKISSQKSKELSQTIVSLINTIRMEKGCKRCTFYHGLEDENVLYLIEEWDTQGNFDLHRSSECFKVLQGAMHLLQEPCEIVSYTLGKKNQPDKEIRKILADFPPASPTAAPEPT